MYRRIFEFTSALFLICVAILYFTYLNTAASMEKTGDKYRESTDTKIFLDKNNGMTPRAQDPAADIITDAKKYDPDCRFPIDHDEADLCIQRGVLKGSHDALMWAQWQSYVGAVSLVFVILSLGFSAWASRAAARAAEEANSANLINMKNFEVDQRAWIEFDLAIDDGLQIYESIFTGTRNASLSMHVAIRNIGKTPALFVHTNITMIEATLWNSVEAMSTLIREFSQESQERLPESSRTILPGGGYDRHWGPVIEDIGENENRSGYFIPTLLISVTYETIFSNIRRHTAYVFHLGDKRSDFGFGSFNVELGDIAKEDIAVHGGPGFIS